MRSYREGFNSSRGGNAKYLWPNRSSHRSIKQQFLTSFAAGYLKGAGRSVKPGDILRSYIELLKDRTSDFIEAHEKSITRAQHSPDSGPAHQQPAKSSAPVHVPADALARAILERRSLNSLSAAMQQATRSIERKYPDATVVQAMKRTRPPVSDIVTLRKETDPVVFLELLARKHAINPSSFPITTGKDGFPRIEADGKSFNLADFGTKHLGRPFSEVAQTLRDAHAMTRTAGSAQPTQFLWREFMDWRRTELASSKQARIKSREKLSADQATSSARYKARKLQARAAPKEMRQELMARARADKLHDAAVLSIARADVREQLTVPPIGQHYRQFLAAQAGTGDGAALTELRRIAEPAQAEAGVTGARPSKHALPLPHFKVQPNGEVHYATDAHGRTAVIDGREGVRMVQTTPQAYDLALRLSLTRYGPELTVPGSDKHRQEFAEAAKRINVPVKISDPQNPNGKPIEVQRVEKASHLPKR